MSEANEAQIEYWNGRTGEKWAALQVDLDAMLSRVTAELQARAGPVANLRVLDIGCGTGETVAMWLAGGAEVTGIDVSKPMLAVAERRVGGRATLIETDAAAWQAAARFDLAVSRFGVMFFADPAAAFWNIAKNVKPGARLLFACWRALAENAWVTIPMQAIADLLPETAPVDPQAPGPFALASKDRLRGILQGAGFVDIAITPFDFPVILAPAGGVAVAVRMAMQIGPASAALTGAAREVLEAVQQRLTGIMAPHEKGGVVTLGGAIWMVEAVLPE